MAGHPAGRDWALVGAVFAALVTVAAVWLALDRRPPEWDHANHLERAVLCARDLGRGDLGAIIDRSSFYPPVVPCAAALVYRLAPSDVAAAQSVILGFLGLGMAATYLLGRRIGGGAAGVVAAVVFGTAPFVVFSSLRFQLDLPLAAMVALALYLLVESDGFGRRGWSVAAGVVIGLGMVTKPPFVVYVAPAFLFMLARAPRRSSLVNAALALGAALVIALPWYGPRLFVIPLQVANRSFKQAAESGQPDALSASSFLVYPRWFMSQFGVPAAMLFVAGLGVAARRRAWFVLASTLVPFAVFEAIQNKNLRYTLPCLPLAAVVAGLAFGALPRRGRVAVGLAIGLAATVQVGATAFAVPASLYIPLVDMPLGFATPPMRDDWRQRELLDAIARDSGGAPRTVSVVPNHRFFSVSNFRYYGVRDGRPLRLTRAWDDEPLGVDYMVLKSGDVGPPWTADKARRVAERLAADAELARVFPVVAEAPLPDGSVATVRVRRVPDGLGATPARVARAVEEAFQRRLPEFARDVARLRIHLEYGDEIRRGEIRRMEIGADTATVGELRRHRAAPLRVHGLSLVLEGLVVNPFSALAGRFEPLDVKGLSLEHATITAEDLVTFLRGQKGLAGVAVALEHGAVSLTLRQPGPDVSARIRLLPSREAPFALVADRVVLGGVPVPGPFVDWIMRNYDPSPRLAQRLPMRVRIGRVSMEPAALRIAGVGGEP